jgi:glycosyltransferase involved in cell wall biosynthesis
MRHPSVQVRRAMPHAEVVEWIGRCAVLVLPSRTEAMGRVLVEAAAAGKPRIGSRVGGIPDVIRHDEDGLLFESGNESELACALERLLSSGNLRRRLGRAAEQRALTEYSNNRFLEHTQSLVDSIFSA